MVDAGVGIDPGLSGAVALVADGGSRYEVHDMPLLNVGRKEYAVAELIEILLGFGKDLPCYLELVSAMPKQGLVSTFRFGQGYGICQASAVAAGHRVSLVRPQTWKGLMLRDVAKTKHAACGRASTLFPKAELRGPRGGLKDGRAEALLLAEMARRETFGG